MPIKDVSSWRKMMAMWSLSLGSIGTVTKMSKTNGISMIPVSSTSCPVVKRIKASTSKLLV
jgi:hypothetical protein